MNRIPLGELTFTLTSGAISAKDREVTLSGSASIDNIGFAIPINSIRGIVESIIEKDYISKPYIGISVLDVSEESRQFGVPAGAAIQEKTNNQQSQQTFPGTFPWGGWQ